MGTGTLTPCRSFPSIPSQPCLRTCADTHGPSPSRSTHRHHRGQISTNFPQLGALGTDPPVCLSGSQLPRCPSRPLRLRARLHGEWEKDSGGGGGEKNLYPPPPPPPKPSPGGIPVPGVCAPRGGTGRGGVEPRGRGFVGRSLGRGGAGRPNPVRQAAEKCHDSTHGRGGEEGP